MNDNVNHPPHYTQVKEKLGVECIQVIEALELNFALGSVMKYIWRHPKKNGIEDLKKARFYLDYEIARLEAALVNEPHPSASVWDRVQWWGSPSDGRLSPTEEQLIKTKQELERE